MSAKDDLIDIQEAGESVRLLESQLEKARSHRAKVFAEAFERGVTQQQIADLAQVSIQTVQADLRAMRRTS